MSKKPTAVVGRSRLSCVVENSLLGALVQVLTDHRVCQIKIEPIDDGLVFSNAHLSRATRDSTDTMKKFEGLATAPYGETRDRRKKQWKPTHETRLGKLILQLLAEHSGPPLTSTQIGAKIAEHYFNKDSASPCLSDLTREKKVERTEVSPRRFTYSLPT